MNYEEFKNDWRNTGQLEYMLKKKVKHIYFTHTSEEHKHCRFCWDKISSLPDTLHEGYYTTNTQYKYWICPSCFDELKDLFEWQL